jgi:hypothetical protein
MQSIFSICFGRVNNWPVVATSICSTQFEIRLIDCNVNNF